MTEENSQGQNISLICPLMCDCSITYQFTSGEMLLEYNHAILFPVQMSFLNLWDKGGQSWEVEGERAREELKVQLDVLAIKCIFTCHLWTPVVWNDSYSPCLVSFVLVQIAEIHSLWYHT